MTLGGPRVAIEPGTVFHMTNLESSLSLSLFSRYRTSGKIKSIGRSSLPTLFDSRDRRRNSFVLNKLFVSQNKDRSDPQEH